MICALASAQTQEPEETKPLESAVVEKARARLVQLDVTLRGPEKSLEDLGPEDFRIKVGGNYIKEFEVDKLCREPSGGKSVPLAGESPVRDEPAPVPTLGPITYLFYFDQPHLTMTGRQEGMETVRQLIPKLIIDGNQGMLVSNAERLETLTDLTSDRQVLLDALDHLEKDIDQWDTFAQEEEKRLIEILDAYRDDYSRALTIARLHYADELWRAERNLRRFSMVLGRLAAVDPPKAVIYLADTMRSNAGEHYLDLFGEIAKRELSEQVDSNAIDPQSTFGALMPFDQVVNQASSHGVRLYTIEAQGLTTASPRLPSTIRVRHAQNTLSGLALETGGRAFLNGVRASKVAEMIVEDLACLYLISFDPVGLAEDQPLPVRVEVSRPKVKAQVRGRIVIQSESARLTSHLLAAFAAPEAIKSDLPVHLTLIPTGYQDGRFSALVQVAVPGSGFPASTWDLGASIISRGKVRETSGRLTVSSPGAPVVLQQSMSFAPGPYEIVAVAHNLTIDVVASRQMEGAWPKPNAELAAVGPIAVVQPTRAAIRKEDQVKTSGALAFSENDPVRIDRPTALMAMICKSRDQKGSLQVERDLVGESAVAFPAMEMELGKESCALIQDLIPAGTMTPGAFSYRIRVLDDGTELARAERKFLTRKDTSTQEVPEDEAPGTGTARGS